MLGVSHALEVLVLGLVVVVYKIQYSSCVFNTVGVLACHIYSWFLPMSWILDLSILLSTCRAYIYIYMFGWLCRATFFLYLLQCVVYHMLSKTRRSSGNLRRVIGEVLLPSLLVVVYKIPYSSSMWARQDVIGVFPSYYCLSGTTCVPVIVQYITTSLLLLST